MYRNCTQRKETYKGVERLINVFIKNGLILAEEINTVQLNMLSTKILEVRIEV